MRSTKDRLRHTLFFEVFGLALCAPLAAWILDRQVMQVGSLSVVLSLAAMFFNFLFNLGFDKILVRLGRDVACRPPWLRAIHAALFELLLMLFTVPVVALWLHMPLWQALMMDIGFTLFYMGYAYLYNWLYDCFFPMPSHGPAQQ